MKIVIDSTTYTTLRNLQFASNTDITAQELPINEFSVDIRTDSDIASGQYAYLYNDDDTLWAKYWIIDTLWYNDKYLTIRAQSDLLLLSRAKLPAKMFTLSSAVTQIQNLFTASGLDVTIDSALNSTTISGYAPEQTARERLQWICFVIGAYIQTDFSDRTKITAISSNTARAALNNIVYYRPQVQYNDWVTGIRLYAYNYFEGIPGTTDTYVQEKINDVVHTYIQSEQVYTITNTEAPATAPENVIEIQDVTLITYGSGSTTPNDILTRLSGLYFKRAEVTADIINNGEFTAGDEVILDDGTGQIVVGYISGTDFSFGHDHKSSITISQADVSEGVELIIIAEDDGNEIGRDTFYLPSGYAYNIQNRYIGSAGFEDVGEDKVYKKTLYRPVNESASGTVGNDTTINTQEYDIALENSNGILAVWIVDEVSENNGVVIIK